MDVTPPTPAECLNRLKSSSVRGSLDLAARIFVGLIQFSLAGIVIAFGCHDHYYDHGTGAPIFQTGPYFFVAAALIMLVWGGVWRRLWCIPLASFVFAVFAYKIFTGISRSSGASSGYFIFGFVEAIIVLGFYLAVFGAQVYCIVSTLWCRVIQRNSNSARTWVFGLVELALMGAACPFIYYLDYQLPAEIHRRWSADRAAEIAQIHMKSQARDERASKAIQRFIAAVENKDDVERKAAIADMGALRDSFFSSDFELGEKLENAEIRRSLVTAIHQARTGAGIEFMSGIASDEREDPEVRRLALDFLLRGTYGPNHDHYIGPSAPEMIPYVLRMVTSDSGATSEQRILGIEALARVSIHSGSEEAMPDVLSKLQGIANSQDENPNVIAAARTAIPQILENRPELKDAS